ncbi:MAG: hypothetical protein M3Z95_06380 [Actinomycetota bacterium]|nr:hypothetical protein [Actinomycetota bacterium]
MAAHARTARAVTRGRLLGGALALFGCMVALSVAPAARAVTITEFPSDAGQGPRYIHVGPDQNLWFAAGGSSPGIGRMRTSGARLPSIADPHDPIDLVTLPNGEVDWTAYHGLGRRLPGGVTQTINDSGDYAIAVTAAGDLRWTSVSGTPEGTVAAVCRFSAAAFGPSTTCAGPSGSKPRLTGLTLGSDGKLWTAGYEENRVRRMNANGTSFEQAFDLPAGSGPARLALGPDGNLWVTMYDASAIDRIAPNGSAMRFPLPAGRGPNDIVQGPDGALWFTEFKGDRIGRMTVTGDVREFPIAAGSQPIGITSGPDGALWFTESATGKIGRLALDSSSGGGGGGVADRVAPRFVKRAVFSPQRFRVASGPTPVSARKRVIPAGSSLSYSLSEPSTVTILIARPASGRKVGTTCRAPSRSNRRNPRCTRYVTVGTLKRHALQGLNKVAFTGRIGRKALKPGSYRTTVSAKDAAANISSPSVTSFTIVR